MVAKYKRQIFVKLIFASFSILNSLTLSIIPFLQINLFKMAIIQYGGHFVCAFIDHKIHV